MTDQLEEVFDQQRPRLFGIAYRILHSASEAEDVLQEAYLRARNSPLSEIKSPHAFFSTIVTRLCIDERRSARAKKESYVGPWLPEPIATNTESDPLERAELVSEAFLIVLQSLAPKSRAAYLLREVFGHSYSELATILGDDESTLRQVVKRASEQIKARRPRFAPTRQAHERIVTGFLNAVQSGDLHSLELLLADDVEAISDGGGLRGIARVPISGRERVSQFFVKLSSMAPAETIYQTSELNGWLALKIYVGGKLFSVVQFESDGKNILKIFSTVSPEKLNHIDGSKLQFV